MGPWMGDEGGRRTGSVFVICDRSIAMSQDEPKSHVPEGPTDQGPTQEAVCKGGAEVQFCARCGQILPPSGPMVVCPACGLRQCPTCGA